MNNLVKDNDVRPDFVAETNAVTGLHSEERSVATGLLRSGEADLPGVVGLRGDKLGKRNAACTKIVTRSLNEGHIHGPCGFTTVSEDPGFCEFPASLDLEFVANAFLDKATLESSELTLLFRVGYLFYHLHHLFFDNLFYRLLLGLSNITLGNELSSVCRGRICVLANNLVRSLVSLSNLEHGVLAVDSLSFAVLAEVVVVANRTHVTDANNGGHFATIAHNSCVLLPLLFGALLLKVAIEESAELAGAVVGDLFAHKLTHLFQTLGAENAGSIAFAAWKTFLVDLGPAALKAINLLFNGFLPRLFAVGDQDLAVSVCVDLVDHSTVSLVGKIHGRETVTTDFRSPDFNLAAGGCVLLARVGVGIFEDHVLGNCGDVDLWD